MQKHVNLVDLVKSFPTNIFLQNLVSIQKRTSPKKFAHSAEKQEKGTISNLSTKGATAAAAASSASVKGAAAALSGMREATATVARSKTAYIAARDVTTLLPKENLSQDGYGMYRQATSRPGYGCVSRLTKLWRFSR